MKKTKADIVSGLVHAACGYGKAGLELALCKPGLGRNPQVAIGNLGIAVELLIKAFVAERNLLLLYNGMPLELRCALAAPEAIPKTFRIEPYKLELLSSTYRSIELDEAIAMFALFCPDFKKRYGSHLRYLSKYRNICVHAVHAAFREYEVDRTVFLFLSLAEYLKSNDASLAKKIILSDEDKNKEFLARFDSDRLERVHSKVEKAKERAKQLTGRSTIAAEEWDWYPYECPVCGSDGILSGETNAEPVFDEDGPCGFSLIFLGDMFECEECGLVLDDYEEMKVLGIDPEIDRSDESDTWEEQYYSDYDD